MDYKDDVLMLYQTGITRASKICSILNHNISQNEVTNILKNYKENKYLEQTVEDVPYKTILDLYRKEELDVNNILMLYPNLTFGQVKLVVEGYYAMLSLKKPRKISFPKKQIRFYLETNNIEDACTEFGYTKETIIRKLSEEKELEEMTKEELFDLKMHILNRDVMRLEENKISKGKFNRAYPNLSLDNAKRLIKEYNEKKSK